MPPSFASPRAKGKGAREGGFYGWPWAYWGIVDDRVPANPEMAAKATPPDYALGGHTASLGLCWVPAGTLPGMGHFVRYGGAECFIEAEQLLAIRSLLLLPPRTW